ncbi:hypothetical protein [Altererythrobacter epoxidivorans]|nr:hypothetical protein [Altererythrobacter epoxidivorans]
MNGPKKPLFLAIARWIAGTGKALTYLHKIMCKYRFITKNRVGKWYPTLEEAQAQANAIGAGFYDQYSGRFTPYRGTLLEFGEGGSRLQDWR